MRAFTGDSDETSATDRWHALRVGALLLIAGLALYLPLLGDHGLWEPWEPKYAQSAREMIERGDWQAPHYRFEPRLNKAPLTYWMIAASQSIFGFSEFAARFPSCLLALLAASGLGFALSARGRPMLGLLAGGMLLTTPQWYLLGRFATPDIPLAASLTALLSLALIWSRLKSERQRWIAILAVGLATSAAGLADWPRGLLLPLWALLGWAALRGSWKGALMLGVVAALYHYGQLEYSVPFNLAAIGAALLFAIVVLHRCCGLAPTKIAALLALVTLLVAPWFVIVHDRFPEEWSLFRYKYAFNLGEEEGDHTAAYHAPMRVAAIGALPWSALALLGALHAVGRRRRPESTILFGALLGGLLFFSLSEAFMGHFYGVLQPAIAGLAALGALALFERLDWRAAVALAAFFWLLALAWDQPGRLLEGATVKSGLFGFDLELSLLTSMVAFLLALIGVKLHGRVAWNWMILLPPLILIGTMGWRMIPALEDQKSIRSVWEAYLSDRQGQEPIAVWGPAKEGLFYYSNNTIERLSRRHPIEEFIVGDATRYVIGTAASLAGPLADIEGQWSYLHQRNPTHHLVRYVPPVSEAPKSSRAN